MIPSQQAKSRLKGLLVAGVMGVVIGGLGNWPVGFAFMALAGGLVLLHFYLQERFRTAPIWQKTLSATVVPLASVVALVVILIGYSMYENKRAQDPAVIAQKAQEAANKTTADQRAAQDRQAAEEAQQRQRTQEKAQTVADLAPKYCASHKKTMVKLASDLTGEGWIGNDINHLGFTVDQCVTIIGKLYDIDSSKDSLQGVVDQKYWVGMNYLLLYYSIGTPKTSNKTTTVAGQSAQLVYDWSPKTVYIYLDGTTVTSYQN